MVSPEQLKIIHLSAQMYYLEDKTQDEIAKTLGVSRPTVSRLLRQARDEGIVRITVLDPFARQEPLARLLKEALDLTEVIVVAGEWGDARRSRQRLGYAAARYLAADLKPEDVLGIGWGRTLYEVADALEARGDLGLTLVPLMGGLGQITPYFQVHELARMFCERLGGHRQALYVPAIIEDETTRTALLESRDVTQVVRAWSQLTVALVGIGSVNLEPEIQTLFENYMDAEVSVFLNRAGAVGDICMRFFDIEGRPIVGGLTGVVGIELEQLRTVPRCIGVAGGAVKAEAILGAVRGRFINILITDESAARRLLALVDRERS